MTLHSAVAATTRGATSTPLTHQTSPDTLHPPADAPIEERWASWQARGRAREATARRRALIATPILALVAAALYALLAR